VAVLLTIFSLLGVYLDRKMGSSPLALLINFFIGFAISGYLFYSAVKKASEMGKRKKKNDKC
jgi:F0F1-type ATP synthase assembly protein I